MSSFSEELEAMANKKADISAGLSKMAPLLFKVAALDHFDCGRETYSMRLSC